MNKIVSVTFSLFLGMLMSSCLATPIVNDFIPPPKPDPAPVELTVDQSAISVKVGAEELVAITKGNGGYTATVIEGENYATATISGASVKIKGVAQGNATVTVKDKENKSTTIKVTVTLGEVIEPSKNEAFEQNMIRAMEIVDVGTAAHLRGTSFEMKRWYNPYTQSSAGETASIWMYTSIIEAANVILHGLEAYRKNGNMEFYNEHFSKYSQLLAKLYDNITYYRGSFTLISFTQTKEWKVYAVPRASGKDQANVVGDRNRNNVYDDQEWLVREMLESYKITGEAKYLTEAEYLTDYVLDGWDTTLDGNGDEHGGIPWGPGYVTMHSCSNAPFISPLVWLHEEYKGKSDEITYRYIGGEDNKTRLTRQMKKDEYYLMYAKKVYDYQKRRLLRSEGVYADMIGGASGTSQYAIYEDVDGIKYRAHTNLSSGSGGDPHSYNSGTMLSGAADLYRVTNEDVYLTDGQALTSATFKYFATADSSKPGCYLYRDTSDFVRWFDGVLMRGYMDFYPYYNNTAVCLASFQNNLDYAYDNYKKDGFLPKNLLKSWNTTTPNSNDNRTEALATFAYAAEYALLAHYELKK